MALVKTVVLVLCDSIILYLCFFSWASFIAFSLVEYQCLQVKGSIKAFSSCCLIGIRPEHKDMLYVIE